MQHRWWCCSLFLGLLLVLALSAPVAAQAVPGPGEGGLIAIDGRLPNLNPLFCTDVWCSQVISLLFPTLLDFDPTTGAIVTGAPGTLASDWSVSEDGRIYTIRLREDRVWSDGAPVITRDFSFIWEVYSSPEVNAASAFPFENLEAVDDYTLRVTFRQPDCTAPVSLVLVGVPAHVFDGVPFSELQAHPFANEPTVTAGPFKFGHAEGGESFTLLPDQTYPDAKYGYVVPTALVFRASGDGNVAVERLLGGEVDVLSGVPVARRAQVRAAAERGDVQISEYQGANWDYMALNMADPSNPQPGLAADGSPIDQGQHPVFGDVRVRQAIGRAVDVDAIIQGAVFGEGVRMASYLIPSSWGVHPTLQPIAYDPDAARRLLEEAGWRDENGDGLREAHGALYAADGTPLRFTLVTNLGNERREAIGTIIQDQLGQVGMEVNFQPVDFSTMLQLLDGQAYDAVIVGWAFGPYADPDLSWIFLPDADVPGYGFNSMSYNNPEVTELMKTALALPGCVAAKRAPYYHRIQEIMQNDMPYLWLYTIKQMMAASPRLHGFAPRYGNALAGADSWWVTNP